MFKVPVDKIIPVTDARSQIASIVKNVQKDKGLYVLTRQGKPAAILASIDYIHNNLQDTKKSSENELSKISKDKIQEPVKYDPPKDDLVLADDDKSDIVPADNDGQNNVVQKKYQQEQPVKISIK